MRVVFRMSAIVAALALIAGCGQRGPLYLPNVPPLPAKPGAQTAPAESAEAAALPGSAAPADDDADTVPDTTGTPLMLTPELPATGPATGTANASGSAAPAQ